MNNYSIIDTIDREYFTGILEIQSVRETFDLLIRLYPELKKVILVVDDTLSGRYSWSQVEPQFEYFPNIEFIRVGDDETFSETEVILSKKEDNTVAIFMTLYKDKKGRFISLKDGVTSISKLMKVLKVKLLSV